MNYLRPTLQVYEKLLREHGAGGLLYLDQVNHLFENSDVLVEIFPDTDPREYAEA